MFIGHFALGYAAKKAAPRTSLATLFGAAALADIIWPILVAAGVETVRILPDRPKIPLEFVSYPWSHSLLMLGVWGAVWALVYFSRTKDLRAAWIIFALVLSHWVLDWMTHLPDMPLWPGGPKFGLGLWNSPTGTAIVELAMFAVGVFIYVRATRPRDGVGRWATLGLIVLFLAAYAANLSSPPPPSIKALWITALIGTAVTLAFAWWSDRHREALALFARLAPSAQRSS